MATELAELLGRIRSDPPFSPRIDPAVLDGIVRAGTSRDGPVAESHGAATSTDHDVLTAGRRVQPVPASPPKSHVDVLHSWLVYRDADTLPPGRATARNAELLVGSLSSFLWLACNPELFTAVISLLLELQLAVAPDAPDAPPGPPGPEHLARDATLAMLRELVDDELCPRTTRTWATSFLAPGDANRGDDVGDVAGPTLAPEVGGTAAPGTTDSAGAAVERWFEWAIAGGTSGTVVEDTVVSMAGGVDWAAVSSLFGCRAVIELYRDLGPRSADAMLQLLFQLRAVPHCLVFEDVLSPFCKHLVGTVVTDDAESLARHLTSLPAAEFHAWSTAPSPTPSPTPSRTVHPAASQPATAAARLPNPLPNPLHYLHKMPPGCGVPIEAVLPFSLLPAASLWLVVDEVVRLAGLPAIPRRFVVRLALGWALIINFLSTSSATMLPSAILQRWNSLCSCADTFTARCFNRIAAATGQAALRSGTAP